MHLGEDVLTALEKAAAEEEKATSKGATWKNKTDTTSKRIPNGRSDDASGPDESSDSGAPLPGRSRGLGRHRTDLVNH